MRSVVFLLVGLLAFPLACAAAEWEMFTKDFYYDKSKVEKLGDKVSVQVKIDTSQNYRPKFQTGPMSDHLVISMVLNCKEMTYKKLSTTSFDASGKVISPDFGSAGRDTELLGSPYIELGKALCVQQPEKAKAPGKKKK